MSHQHSCPHCLYAYHSITLSSASAAAGSQTLPLWSPSLIPWCCALSYRETPPGDSLWDRLIIAFHKSHLRHAPSQFEPDRSTVFLSGTSGGSFSPLPYFLDHCVDKLTQAPVVFTPGMRRERDREYRKGDGKRKHKGERLARDDKWHRVCKSRVIAEGDMEKADQQLATPYITFRRGLLGIDF